MQVDQVKRVMMVARLFLEATQEHNDWKHFFPPFITITYIIQSE